MHFHGRYTPRRNLVFCGLNNDSACRARAIQRLRVRLCLSLECDLEVLRVNARFGALRPSHRWSLCSVHFDELGLGRASGKGIEAGTPGALRQQS